mgnify:CR=1 FL=1
MMPVYQICEIPNAFISRNALSVKLLNLPQQQITIQILSLSYREQLFLLLMEMQSSMILQKHQELVIMFVQILTQKSIKLMS